MARKKRLTLFKFSELQSSAKIKGEEQFRESNEEFRYIQAPYFLNGIDKYQPEFFSDGTLYTGQR